MTGPLKQARKDRALDELACNVLSSFKQMRWTDWYETTAARRGGRRRLSTRTFSTVVKRLVASGQARKDKDDSYDIYRIVYDAVEAAEDGKQEANNLGNSIPAAVKNSRDVETGQCSTALTKAHNGDTNLAGNDTADIALQQLIAQDS